MFKIRTFIGSDIDYIISRQINLYEAEYGFNTDAWKAYIADGVNQFIEPSYRGLGIGNKLMEMVISFCKNKKYKRVILWTFSELFAA